MTQDLLLRVERALRMALEDPDDIQRIRIYVDRGAGEVPWVLLGLPPDGPDSPAPEFMVYLTDLEASCQRHTPNGFDGLQSICEALRLSDGECDRLFPEAKPLNAEPDVAEQLVQECLQPVHDNLLEGVRDALAHGKSPEVMRRALAEYQEYLLAPPESEVLTHGRQSRPNRKKKKRRPRKKQ